MLLLIMCKKYMFFLKIEVDNCIMYWYNIKYQGAIAKCTDRIK